MLYGINLLDYETNDLLEFFALEDAIGNWLKMEFTRLPFK